ncbi:MAG TPA: heparin lyase I family protein [Phycisphaerae bacterium]|nr:heparin lyase I family protein [Phycisphaerae bacterium]
MNSIWMNGKHVADWRGNIGKNDSPGPYFKFGIYKPGPGGFQVDHAACRRTIQRTRKSPEVPNPLRDEVLRSRADGGDATRVDRWPSRSGA